MRALSFGACLLLALPSAAVAEPYRWASSGSVGWTFVDMASVKRAGAKVDFWVLFLPLPTPEAPQLAEVYERGHQSVDCEAKTRADAELLTFRTSGERIATKDLSDGGVQPVVPGSTAASVLAFVCTGRSQLSPVELTGADAVVAAKVRSQIPNIGFANEKFIAPLPAGFKIGAASAPPHQRVVEAVPQSETVESWTRMVTFQVVFGLKTADPDQIPTGMSKLWVSGCPGGAATKLSGAVERGYPSSLWMFACPLNRATGKPETTWMKTLSGADSTYSAQYAFRSQAGDGGRAAALSYLAGVFVCDTRKPDRPCPSPSTYNPVGVLRTTPAH